MTSERILSLQALRALAATGVIVSHAFDHAQAAAGRLPDNTLDTGMIGVDVFFVLSGYIITRSALTAPSGIEFFKRRWVRVAPVYYLMSLPMLFWLVLHGEPYAQRLLATLFFWPVGPSRLVYPTLAVGWTLCFEMLFYTSIALFVRCSRLIAIALAACLVGFQAMRYLSPWPIWTFLGNPILAEFLFGAALTKFPTGAGPRAGVFVTGLAVVLITFIGALGLKLGNAGLLLSSTGVAGDLPWLRVALFGLPSVLLVWGALLLEPWFRGVGTRLAAYIGDASYSLYLSHQPVLACAFAAAALLGMPLPLVAVGGIALSIACGVLVYEGLERPLLKSLRRLRPSQRLLSAA